MGGFGNNTPKARVDFHPSSENQMAILEHSVALHSLKT